MAKGNREMSVTPTQDQDQDRKRMAPPGTSTLRAALASAALVFVALPCVSAGATTVSPLPASDYTVHPVCAAPAPGHAGCLALELVAQTAAARAHTHPLGMTRSRAIQAAKAAEGAFGLRPADLHAVYQLPITTASTQTIALVDAYDDTTAEHDLGVYDQEFGLAGCTAVNGCLTQVNQRGEAGNLPVAKSNKEKQEADEWALETSLDIEVARAVCQSCRIALVEADSASFSDLEAAEETAVGLGATEISDSWGGPECAEGPGGRECIPDSSAFNHSGVVITAAAGDDGYLDWDAEEGLEKGYADYPATSPHVVAVGGTRLSLGPGSTWAGETVWNGDGAGGGGCSVGLTAAPWQLDTADWPSVGCGTRRAVADVSADADPYTGVAIYDSTPESPTQAAPDWIPLGGTSLASPLIASVFALAGGVSVPDSPAKTLYENEIATPGSLHDVASGSNGECSQPFQQATGVSGCTELQEAISCSEEAICLAKTGYDGPTGVGTPDGIAAFQPSTEGAGGDDGGNKGANGGTNTGESSGPVNNQPPPAPVSAVLPNVNPSPGPPATPGANAIVPILSAAALTKTATAALGHRRPRAAQLAFAFTLNVQARVQVGLAKLVVAHRHKRWQTLPYSLTIAGTPGRDSARLSAHVTLTPGRYRLTLAPVNGTARRLTFQIG